jgi:hypothetical protein
LVAVRVPAWWRGVVGIRNITDVWVKGEGKEADWGEAKKELIKWTDRLEEKGGKKEAEEARKVLNDWP